MLLDLQIEPVKSSCMPEKGRRVMPRVMLAVAAFMVSACTILPEQEAAPSAEAPTPAIHEPEGPSGYMTKEPVEAEHYMVVAAHPLAAEAGNTMLKAGGAAIDAAIAAQMVLTLVEPQSSGIGGGAFLMHFDGKEVRAYDGRETAPAAADSSLFLDAAGKPLPFYDAVVGGKSVGVPGVLRMLELTHRRYGRLPWASLFEPAIRLAEEGFPVSPRLATLLQSEPHLRKDPVAAAYFYDAQGNPWPEGHHLTNPALAEVLREIAMYGAKAFYEGPIARDIVHKVKGHPAAPGRLTEKDMLNYRAVARQPVCSDYRQWTVCGMPPPSSGGIAVAQILGILSNTEIKNYPPRQGQLQTQAVHLFSEAGRLAYADRNRYVADTDFVPLPGNSVELLIDERYLAWRATLIGSQSMGKAKPGHPLGIEMAAGDDVSPERPATSHLSIVDRYGNALAMTTSIENAFGSRQMVHGFLLNNQLTDFSFTDSDEHGPIANRVQGGKRPRSSMAPTLVFDKRTGKLVMAIGSPGGSAIINYVAKVLVGTLDWQLDIQQAISLPNFGSRNGPTELEQDRTPPSLIEGLQAKGHTVRVMPQTSGLHGISRVTSGLSSDWLGGADPRREGVALGE
jgi:gamma-glutamyltranspeptidase/glutathione hydrolase